MEKTITCAECNANYTYDENPKYPRNYCANCSAKKQDAWENKDKVISTAMPISEQRIIVRQSSLKSAVEYTQGNEPLDVVKNVAEQFENWVFR